MSSSNKTSVSSGGRGSSKTKHSQQHGKSDHQSKSSDSSKHDKSQKNDQRNAHIIDTRSAGGEDLAMKERVKQVMEMTRRSEDDVIMALHDNDGDLNRAVNDLLEGLNIEWEVKKKKARQPSGSKQNAEQPGRQEESADWEDRRGQRGAALRGSRGRANHDNRRSRENKENEKNMEDGVRDGGFGGNRRGRGGSARSGRGGRGGGRGVGHRTFANRSDMASSSTGHSFNRPIDTWAGSEEQQSTQEPKMDGWNNLEASDDWDNEEYTGSLTETKVFTPSTNINESTSTIEETKMVEASMSSMQREEMPKMSDVAAMQQQQQQQSLVQQQTAAQSMQPVLGMPSLQLTQQSNAVNSGSLTAAQTQYLTKLTQQTSESLKASGQSGFSSSMTSQPQRQPKQRPRVPPPSKIPSSAVEMPGDAVSNSISFLDVQFGALDFTSDSSSLEGTTTEKYSSSSATITGIEVPSSNTVNTSSTTNSLDIETTQTSTNQYSSTSQMLSNDNLPVSSEHTLNSQSGFSSRGGSSATQSLDITKQDFTTQVSPGNAPVYGTTMYQSQKSYQASSATPSSYNVYSSNTQSAPSSFPSVSAGNANSYSATASVSQPIYSSSAYPQSSTSNFSQATPSASVPVTTYSQTTTTNQTYQSSGAYAPTTTSQYQTQSSATNTVSNSNSAYQTTGYQSSSSFQSTPQAYQPSNTTFTSPITQASTAYQSAAQSVYASPYSYSNQSQSGSHNHKLNSSTNKDSQYENSTTTSSNSLATTSAPTLGLSSASVNSSQTKVTSSNAVPKCTASGGVSGSGGTASIAGSGAASNMTPMLAQQYIMGQGMPYFQQTVYSYEDLQLLQQRLPPHMPTTGYYDTTLGYQTTGPATSLGGNRGDALSGVQAVQGVQGVQGAYSSINDARFARNDSNASPVPSTMSQQTATQHQQPMMNPIPPGYAYFTYGGSIMPAGSFQYGTPAIYPPIATAGNAGTSSGAYSAKPGNYGSGYGGGASYDTLASGGPTSEYKGAGSGYTGTQSGKTGTSTGNTNTGGSSAADISATMYAKSHVALNKVNSYDKQTFHSATPPPFGLTGSQNAGIPSGYGAAHLFIPHATIPHHLQQPLHQDGASNTGQRSNSSSQNKAQSKPNYSPSYWTGGN